MSKTLPRYAKPLAIFLHRLDSFFLAGERARDCGAYSCLPMRKCRAAFFGYMLKQVADERVHPTHDLHAGGSATANLVES